VVKARVVVVYVEYSLSPEVKYPVALEETYSSILWVYENAASINVDPSKLTVFGDSAGKFNKRHIILLSPIPN
jgi:acetyl esterase